MNRRPLWVLLIVGVLVVAGAFAFGTGLLGSGAGASASPGTSPGASGSPAALATRTGTGSPSAPAPSSVAPASPAPSCVGVAQRVAVRATAADTGFPIPVQWTDLGPADDLHLFLSDVAPTILITPAGPSSLNVGLNYITGGDNVAFTAGSVTLTYDPATGRVSGPVATGYGKNSNRATRDSQPSSFEGVLTRPDSAGMNGLLTGSIAHPARTFEFRVAMIEKIIQVATGPGCASARPTDSTPAP